jgi:hypothetical protein
MTVTRRSFLRTLLAAAPALTLAPPLFPTLPAYTKKEFVGTVVFPNGTVGGINRAAFSFWRNQQQISSVNAVAFEQLRRATESIYRMIDNDAPLTEAYFTVDRSVVAELDRLWREGAR